MTTGGGHGAPAAGVASAGGPEKAVRRAALAIALAGMWLLSGARAEADIVAGYVLDAVRQVRVPGVEVAFLVAAEDGGTAEIVRRTTDADGAFEFSGPFLTPGTAFVLVAQYRGLTYDTETLFLGDQDGVIVEVYDGTEDDGRIHIDTHRLFLAVTGTGVEVAQVVTVGNHGQATYVGRLVGDQRHVLEFSLPEASLGLQGHAGDIVRAAADRAVDTRPLPPGTEQVAFTYRVPADDFDGDYVHEVLYPTGRLDLFVQPTHAFVGPPFQDLGQSVLHDQTYRHYRLENLIAGRRVTIPLPFSRPMRWALKWAMLALVPAVLATAVALARPGPRHRPAADQEGHDEEQRGPVTGEDRRDLEQRRQLLLRQLAALDAGDGAVVDGAHTGPVDPQQEPARQRLLADLADLYRRLGLDG